MPEQAIIEAVGLSKTYRQGLRRRPVTALDGFAVSVRPGEVFGLLGPNGAGKTTFIKLMLGAARPSAGSVRLFGRDTGDPVSRRHVGYLPEHNRFPGHLTANHVLDCYGRLAGLDAETRRKRSAYWLSEFGLADRADHRVRTYSKGMTQRLGLAQVLLNDPTLVVLDEPTDGVDPIGRREIRELVNRLAEEGKSVFLNSHILSEVEQVCTSVAILDRGKVVAAGSVQDLTRVEGAWRIVCTPVEVAVRDRLGLTPCAPDPGAGVGPVAGPGIGHGLGLRHGELESYRVVAAHRSEIQPVLAGLLQSGVAVESVIPDRRSLEESFLSLLVTPND